MKFLLSWTFTFGSLFGVEAQTSDLFKPINTVYDEQAPVFSPDGKVLYFTVANHPLNIGGKKDPGDIWFSVRMDNSWSAPVHGGSFINDRNYNAVADISSDGEKLLLLSHYSASTNPVSTQGISISTRHASGWSKPQNINIPYFLNREAVLSGAFDQTQTVFVFSAESYSSLGAEDLYVTFYQDGKWTEPKSLGSVINGAFQELTPSLSKDSRMLYFSTNGRKGLGSFDVYAAERLDDSWTRWSEPTNMGPRINSEARELYYREFPTIGVTLYTSTRNSDGYGDMRSLTDANTQTIAPDSSVRIMEIKRDPGNLTKEVKLFGQVQSTVTSEPLAARIVFKGKKVYNITTNKDGLYEVTLPSTEAYGIQVSSKGHINTLEQLDIHTYEMQTLELNFRLQPIAVGTTVNLKSVLFKISSTSLLPESYPELDVVVEFLKANPGIEIELLGHTDNKGDPKMNIKLSKARVETVKKYLTSKGIAGNRIRGKGLGGTKPIASGDREESRRLNRRVEFTILKD
jgi:outer membrane protein OmpA-like peptidoglycan-associated protein